MLFEVTFSYSLGALAGETTAAVPLGFHLSAQCPPLGTNVEYERHFHRMHMYQRGVFDNFPLLTEVMDMLWWPVKESVQMYIVSIMGGSISPSGMGVTTRDTENT